MLSLAEIYVAYIMAPLPLQVYNLTLLNFLRATAGTATARLSHRNSVRLSVCLSVRHTGGSGKNGAS